MMKTRVLGTSVVPFPLDRRRGLVRNITQQMLARSHSEAERHLAFELRRHHRILRRRQISNDVIEAEDVRSEAPYGRSSGVQ